MNEFDLEKRLSDWTDIPKDLSNRALKVTRRSSLSTTSAIYTAMSAWLDADMHKASLDKSRIGLIVVGQNFSAAFNYANYQKFYGNLDYLPPSYGIQYMDSYLIGVISEVLQINGPGIAVSGASASGGLAVVQGLQWLRARFVDYCLIVAPAG